MSGGGTPPVKPSPDLYVNLGLPSGTLWAKTNLDYTQANGFAISEFQYQASFVSWANVVMHNAVEDVFEYDFGTSNAEAPWFEGQPYGETPGSLVQSKVLPSHDVARVIAGKPWRLPTVADFNELLTYTDYIDANGDIIPDSVTSKTTTVNDVVGIYLRSKVNGARLFLPCCGTAASTSLYNVASYGLYWTSDYGDELNAPRLAIYVDTGVSVGGASKRSIGVTIRPVWVDR